MTILIVIGLYLALAFVALHFIPAKELMANADIAVAVAANRLMGDWGYALMYITAVIAFISGIGATYFSIFRISYALAQQHILPEFYHRRFWQRGTWGNLLTVLLMLAATLWFDFNQIVNLSSAAYLISYLAVFSANWILRRETKSSPTMIVIGIGLMLFIFLAFMASLVIEA
ncbi:MAG: amino acid permease [Alphaproteobacteria bacterium]